MSDEPEITEVEVELREPRSPELPEHLIEVAIRAIPEAFPLEDGTPGRLSTLYFVLEAKGHNEWVAERAVHRVWSEGKLRLWKLSDEGEYVLRRDRCIQHAYVNPTDELWDDWREQGQNVGEESTSPSPTQGPIAYDMVKRKLYLEDGVWIIGEKRVREFLATMVRGTGGDSGVKWVVPQRWKPDTVGSYVKKLNKECKDKGVPLKIKTENCYLEKPDPNRKPVVWFE